MVALCDTLGIGVGRAGVRFGWRRPSNRTAAVIGAAHLLAGRAVVSRQSRDAWRVVRPSHDQDRDRAEGVMATAERQVTLAESPEAAVQTCVRALTAAGFKNMNAGPRFVSAQKRAFGQWTKGQIALTIAPDGETRVNDHGASNGAEPHRSGVKSVSAHGGPGGSRTRSMMAGAAGADSSFRPTRPLLRPSLAPELIDDE